MIALLSAAQMRALDADTIALGLGAFTLMETAGRGVALHVLAARPGLREVAVVCGSGGNGGDGFVVARVLRDHGVAATVYLAVEPPAESAAGAHRRLFLATGGRELSLSEAAALEAARPAILGSELVVDALFGVGLTRPVTGHLAHVVEVMNAAPLCWAIDVPSGLCADRGVPLGTCVRARVTVSLGLHKLGVVTAPGFAYAGELRLVDIGLPAALVRAASPAALLLEDPDCARLLPAADPLAHKGSRGHVLVLGGSPGMRGAGELASRAALRAGAGLCTWAAPRGASEPPAGEPSIMVRELERATELSAMCQGKAALCVGPGLGRSEAAAALFEAACAAAAEGGSALVLDADALYHLAAAPRALGACRAVVTPHPKEAARLAGCTVEELEADRLRAAHELAQRLGAVCVLKGARTVISDGESAWLCAAGSEALATGGSGDVLAGVIAGLCAQGLAPAHAAQVAVQVHGHAGRRLAERLGPRGVVASDLPMQVASELGRLRG